MSCRLGKEAFWDGRRCSPSAPPTVRQGIALALLGRSVAEGDEVVVDVRDRDVPATVTRPPFVRPQAR